MFEAKFERLSWWYGLFLAKTNADKLLFCLISINFYYVLLTASLIVG